MAALLAGVAAAQSPIEEVTPFSPEAQESIWPPASAAVPDEPYRPLPSVHPLVKPFLVRTLDASALTAASTPPADEAIPFDFEPWWESQTIRPMQASSLGVDVDGLLRSALRHSPNIRALSVEPSIRETLMVEQSAAFDWRTFLETAYLDRNDPIGSQLTTGNDATRFKDKNWNAGGGLRRTNPLGGQVEMAQRMGAQRNNSRFLLPNPQGTTRLEMNYTHPLMNGSGRAYNRSQIVLADIDTHVSREDLTRQLQDHLLQVTVAYWDLYRARTRYVQRVTLNQAAEQIYEKLAGREQVDTLYRQVLRAKAAVAKRRSEIVRAATQIENAEAQLRVLVNDPELMLNAELTPQISPLVVPVQLSMRDSLTTALAHRPDIALALRSLDATSIRLGVARNELLPRLDLLLSSYVAGLQDDADVFSAWGNQFTTGRPGFSAGLLWELPKGNRVAIAREQRRRLELQRASSEFENTVETSMTEVEIAVREVATSYGEMLGKYRAMLAAADETRFLSDRYELLPGANDSAPLLLEDLLDAQERQSDEEAAYVDAQVSYTISLIRLRKSMGTLLRSDAISQQLEGLPSDRPRQAWDELQLPVVPPAWQPLSDPANAFPSEFGNPAEPLQFEPLGP